MEGMMTYMNLLSQLNCNNCPNKDVCFLQRMPLQNYPEATQYFILKPLSQFFKFDNKSHRWRADYQAIENQLIVYYDSWNYFIPANNQVVLSPEAQKESDRKFIRDTFKHLLDIAAKATEDSDSVASMLFDGIGLVLASDYLEAVHKVLSMFRTCSKAVNSYDNACTHYSAGI